ncbi:hypothetical protein [Pseudarthrobacter sp. S9]
MNSRSLNRSRHSIRTTRQPSNAIKKLNSLGFNVTITPATAA